MKSSIEYKQILAVLLLVFLSLGPQKESSGTGEYSQQGYLLSCCFVCGGSFFKLFPYLFLSFLMFVCLDSRLVLILRTGSIVRLVRLGLMSCGYG